MRSNLLKSEDYWAIWLGGTFLVFGIICYLFIAKANIGKEIKSNDQLLTEMSEQIPFKSIAFYKAKDQSSKLVGSATPLGKGITKILKKPNSWKNNPFAAFIQSPEDITNEEKLELQRQESLLDSMEKRALELEEKAKEALYQDEELNAAAASSAKEWSTAHSNFEKTQKKYAGKGYNIIASLILLALILAAIFGVGAYFMGNGYFRFVVAFIGVFALAIIAYMLASQVDMKNLGISYAIWAIVLGLIISNTVGVAAWLKPAVQTEYYIKTGLVLLGSEVLLGKIMAIGLPGIFVAWVVTPIVLVTTYWFGQKVLKIGSKTLNITISAD
ncbi:UNVERIFIED_CONTAM: hypothetical protein GTU68_025793, partial [Idotea baltica]|nr:hypothetical protein [Idotea baltica]